MTNTIAGIEVIDTFLANWKVQAEEYYRGEMARLYEMFERYDAQKSGTFNKADRELYAQQIEEMKNYSALALDLQGYGRKYWEDRLLKVLDKEVERKKKSFIATVEKKAGAIVDASGLSIGDNADINGTVIGEVKTVKVSTITAGGYNIQCLHYRVLVK